MTDYEIAASYKMKKITDVASKYAIEEDVLELYGPYKAKIDIHRIQPKEKKGKLILVTSTSPTPYGEGKTTLSIGINDALNSIGKKSIVVLREPSLGPVFGIKGGATGGGQSQIVPMDDINLHFTGDIHAVTSANNLLSAIIDNHIFQGNELNIDVNTINFRRCQDVNDRALRRLHLTVTNREEKFNISTASEMMAILCLAKDMEDLKRRLGNIFIGYTKEGKCIFARDLKCVGALAILLKDAIKPNIVQTLEGNLAIIHGGPFANIAHGCNSIIATNLALDLADYVITEAGFGSDMGGLKFLDIKCRENHLKPNLIIINTTIRGLKYNGIDKNDLPSGLSNLEFHIENMKKYSNQILVVLNKFQTDTDEEIALVEEKCKQHHTEFALSDCYALGSKGGVEVANKVVALAKEDSSPLWTAYDLEEPLEEKLRKICIDMLHAKDVIIDESIQDKFEQIATTKEFANLPICVAKTQYSISDDAKKLGYPKDFTMKVTDVYVNSGAGFITICMGSIMTMPGLSKQSNYLNMDIQDNSITGLF